MTKSLNEKEALYETFVFIIPDRQDYSKHYTTILKRNISIKTLKK